MPAFLAIAGVPAMLGSAAAGGVAAGAAVYGSRRAGQASRRASDITERSNAAAEADLRAQREEEQRRFAADEAHRQREFAAAEEERAFQREQADERRQREAYSQRLLEEREARQAPYRAMSAQALGNLGQMLGLDLGNTPLANNLTAPRPAGGPNASGAPAPMFNDSGRPMQPGPAPWGSPGSRVPMGERYDMPIGVAGQPLNMARRRTLGDVTGLQRTA